MIARRAKPVVESLVVPLAVVVHEVLTDRSPQMSFAQRHDPVHAFAFDREHESLGVCVQVRTSRWQQQRLYPCPAQHLPELLRIQRIPVQDQIALPAQESVVDVEQVTGHLLHPLAARIPRQPYHLDESAPDVDHEQHVVPEP
jgi:hypothetical protein